MPVLTSLQACNYGKNSIESILMPFHIRGSAASNLLSISVVQPRDQLRTRIGNRMATGYTIRLAELPFARPSPV